MKITTLSLILLLLLGSVSLAQAPAPEVFVQGYLRYQNQELGIISTEVGTRMVEPGQKLGDYHVVSLSAKDGFVFGYKKQRFLVKWEDGVPSTGKKPKNNGISVRLSDASVVYTAKAIARLMDLDFYCGSEVVGSLTLAGTFSPDQLLKALTAAGQLKIDYAKSRDSLIVARAKRIPAVENALRSKPINEKEVTFDFVNADMAYVLQILAKELGFELDSSPRVQGAVTVQVKNGNVSRLLRAILALQVDTFEASIVNKTLKVR